MYSMRIILAFRADRLQISCGWFPQPIVIIFVAYPHDTNDLSARFSLLSGGHGTFLWCHLHSFEDNRRTRRQVEPDLLHKFVVIRIAHERRLVPVVRRGCVRMFDRSSWCIALREKMSRRGTVRPAHQFKKGTVG